MEKEQEKKILYIDMDNVLVDFKSGIRQLSDDVQIKYKDHLDDVPGIFSLMKPMEGAIEAYRELSKKFDTYILSTAPWENPSAWTDKLLWVKKHLGTEAYKKLNISHHKNLFIGDFLVDDRDARGAKDFKGTWIHFGQKPFENWDKVMEYLVEQI